MDTSAIESCSAATEPCSSAPATACVSIPRKGNARDDIWTYGHRNILAAAVHPDTGQLWAFEMGPLGGDELNIIQPWLNYGWPAVSDGDNYDRSPIPDHSTRPEFAAPVKTWTPVISPSGAVNSRQ